MSSDKSGVFRRWLGYFLGFDDMVDNLVGKMPMIGQDWQLLRAAISLRCHAASAGGPSRVLPFAFSFGVLGIAASFGSDQLHEYKIRRALVKLETEETDLNEHTAQLDEHRDGLQRREKEESASSMWDWLPVRRATDDEIRRREHKVEESIALQKQRENNGP